MNSVEGVRTRKQPQNGSAPASEGTDAVRHPAESHLAAYQTSIHILIQVYQNIPLLFSLVSGTLGACEYVCVYGSEMEIFHCDNCSDLSFLCDLRRKGEVLPFFLRKQLSLGLQ